MGDLEILLFLAALAIIVTIIHIFMKQAGREEYGYLVLFVGIMIALIKVVPYVLDLFQEVESVFYYF